MPLRKKTRQIAEFGDFQTPLELATDVCSTPALRRLRPRSIVEPTCGSGSFLIAALGQFPSVEEAIGLDVNPDYVESARTSLQEHGLGRKAVLRTADFFTTNWEALLQDLPEPLLVIGNPPWVTNTELSLLDSSNLPIKSNFQGRKGFDAVTGKSNFDISEWMLLRLLEWLDGRHATVAMLCKTAIARKVLLHVWKHDLSIQRSEIRRIDAMKHFGAAVDACLLVCRLSGNGNSDKTCPVYDSLSAPTACQCLGFRGGSLISNVESYERWSQLQVGKELYRWRSGVKHDCSRVMEFQRDEAGYRNATGECVDIEQDYLFPMLKSSQLANGHKPSPQRWMLVTQRNVGDDTTEIRDQAPKTWNYLLAHAKRLDGRGSSIYRKRPRFSVFGVGAYTFAPWKVAISGFYKKLKFAIVGTLEGKPTVLDDTAYFVACRSRREAKFVAELLNSDIAGEFLSSFIFWDTKRPITTDVLRRLDLRALAQALGREAEFERFRPLEERRIAREPD